jgi:cytochrome c553
MSNTLCLACHGKPYLEVQTEHYNYIKANYASQPKAYKLKEIMAYWKIK